ncbi:MAG: HIT family protein [Paludibacteraceae bacterium]|jgi:histidine triad (HIT) family protein|nr:HIT family protein [Paludibacteraceae bacterium]
MTIFTKIINGDIPSFKVAEDERYYAFLDINPLKRGHVLVIPKLPEPEADYIFDLDDDTLSGLIVFAKMVAQGIKKAIPCQRVGMAVLGMEVNHVHIHLIPLDKETDMLFTNPKLKLTTEEMAEIANSIAVAIDGGED